MKALRLLFAASLVLAGCIRNDLDYPLVFGGFTSFEVEGAKNVDIDNNARTITVDLTEGAEMEHLKLTSYGLTDKTVLDGELPEYLDLSSPLEVLLKTYQDYKWTIRATQTIVRYVNCEKQVGQASINPEKHFILLQVIDNQPLSSIVFTGMKLGPEGSVVRSTTGYESTFEQTSLVSRQMYFPITLDCVLERTFDVEFRGKTTTWSLKAVQIAVTMEVRSVVPWCHKADVKAVFSGKSPAALEYKKASDAAWTEVTDAKLSGVGITATLKGLSADTDYVVRVRENGEYSEEYRFHTDTEVQLYNMGFDDWYLDGKVWYPFPEGAPASQLVWDSANKATASFLGSISTPDGNFVAVSGPGKNSVKLESTYAMVKFAAGNIFNGQFVKLKGMGAELAWGTPFTTKPVALHGYYCYRPALVTDAEEPYLDLIGQNDNGQIRIILTDWDEQFHVLSAEKVFVDFEKDPHIIAYAEKRIDETNDGYVEFTLPLEYRSYRTPKWVVIVGASSYLGDFYTGGRGSTLWLDEFSFIYE